MKIDSLTGLPLNRPALRALADMGVTSLSGLHSLGKERRRQLPGWGPLAEKEFLLMMAHTDAAFGKQLMGEAERRVAARFKDLNKAEGWLNRVNEAVRTAP